MKYRVKASIPSEKRKGTMEKWNFWVFGKNDSEAKQTAESKLIHVVGGPGGVIHTVRKNSGRNLRGGIGDFPIYKGV